MLITDPAHSVVLPLDSQFILLLTCERERASDCCALQHRRAHTLTLEQLGKKIYIRQRAENEGEKPAKKNSCINLRNPEERERDVTMLCEDKKVELLP